MIFYLLISLNLSLIYSEIVLELKKETSSNFYENFLMEYKTNLEIGNPIQTIPSKITFSNNYYFIIGDGNTNFYEKEKSLSFNLGEKLNESLQLCKEIYESTETFYFKDLKGKKNEIKNFKFIYALKPKIEKELFHSQIGFSIHSLNFGKSYNLIYELKKRNIIKSYTAYFDFNKDNSKIVMGGFPEDYEKETNSKIYFTKIDNVFLPEYIQLHFDNSSLGNEELDYKIEINFDFNKEGIVGNEYFKNKINEKIFNKYFDNKICTHNNFSNFIFYQCNNKFEIDKFPTLKFYHKDMNITLEFNYKDLFQKIKDVYYFMIIFNTKNVNKWIFGSLFLKKYKTIINPDRGIIGFYIPSSELSDKNWFLIVISFILLIIVGCLSYYYYYLLKNKRKARVNEIEDDFEYLTQK